MYQDGLQDRGNFSVGWLRGRDALRNCWNDRPFQHWIKKLFIYKQRETKGLHGYFQWLNTLNPMGDCVGRGQLTQCWLACLYQWWIQSKGTFQHSPYLFLLAASAEWQWCLVAAQMNVWRFPHTRIPQNHKTHLLTLNWHTWEGFPSGEQGTRERRRRRMWRERRTEQTAKNSRREYISGEYSLSMRRSPLTSPSHSDPHPLGQYLSCHVQTSQWHTPAWEI